MTGPDGDTSHYAAAAGRHSAAADPEEAPSTGEEWIINHIRKLEIAVDEILFALRAGGYAACRDTAGGDQ